MMTPLQYSLRYYILDAERRPVATDSIEQWGLMFHDMRQRRVASTDITPEIHVSTVFVGLDHRYFGEGPPLLFETMVFGGPMDQQQWRYASWDDAETGHATAVRMVRNAMQETAEPTIRDHLLTRK